MADQNPLPPGQIPVPLEYLQRFLEDPEAAAVDWLAVPQPVISPFFRDLNRISGCIKDYPNPLNWDTYAIDPEFIAKDDFPRFIHCDLSIRRDAVGISMCHVPHFVELQIRTNEGEIQSQPMPFIKFDLCARLKPRPEFSEREIDYDAILGIFLELARRNFRIDQGIVTFDRFQSHWMISTLRKEGFICSLLSVDYTTSRVIIDWNSSPYYIKKEPLPREPSACYVLGRDLMYQNRLSLPQIPLWIDRQTTWFEREVLGTTWDEKKERAGKAEGETDDLLQSILGAAFNAHNNADRLPIDAKNILPAEDGDSWYSTLSKGDPDLGIEPREDLVSDDDIIDPSIGYIPDDRDIGFLSAQDRFREMF